MTTIYTGDGAETCVLCHVVIANGASYYKCPDVGGVPYHVKCP